MKIQVLKALANPARIFYVPYDLALFNFIIQFLIYITTVVIGFITINDLLVDPLFFLGSVVLVHLILAAYSKKEPQLMQIILAKINMFRKKIPGSLKV